MDSRSLIHLLRLAGLGLLYVAAGCLGLWLAPEQAYLAPVWPASGVALAGLLLWGYRLWPAIPAGALIVHGLFGRLPLTADLGIALGATLEALLGFWLLQSRFGFQNTFTRV